MASIGPIEISANESLFNSGRANGIDSEVFGNNFVLELDVGLLVCHLSVNY